VCVLYINIIYLSSYQSDETLRPIFVAVNHQVLINECIQFFDQSVIEVGESVFDPDVHHVDDSNVNRGDNSTSPFFFCPVALRI